MRLGDSISPLGSGRFGSNGLGWHDCMVSLSAGPSISLEKGPFFAQPSFTVRGEVRHDLRSKGEDQLVIFSLGWRDATENALRAGANVFVNNALVFKLSGSKQWRLRRTGRRVLVGRVQDGVLDGLAVWSCRQSAASRRDGFAVRRNGR